MALPEILVLTNFYALSFVGVPYIWKGNGPDGFDCSGFSGEIAKSRGLMKIKDDLTAQQMFDKFSKEGRFVESLGMEMGSFVFYGKTRSTIEHVAYALNNMQIIEAGGGDKTVTTPQHALLKNAFVRVRKFDYRTDLIAIMRPVI